jgi:hypothetical protein
MLCTTLEYHVLITLPLWILSGIFHYLLPLAITSMLASLAVCVAAASQAELPQSKERAWSRPLVAWLFFLQPIVRGWARYQGRLLPRAAPLAAQQSLDSIALRESGKSLDQVDYWSPVPLDRLQFVRDVLRQLEQQGWPTKSDIGWSEYDVEIYGSRWNQLQLATVSEDHAQGRHLVRCRLRIRWSLQAKVMFWGLAGLELLLLGLVGRWWWLWLVLFSVPLFAWFLRRQGRSLQSMIVVFLDHLAKHSGLIKLQGDSTSALAAPGIPAPSTAAPQPGQTPEPSVRPLQTE